MDIDLDSLELRHNEERRRYEAVFDGETAEAVYDLRGGAMRFLHTAVPDEFEGHGIAGRLAQFALDDARARGLKVVPLCPFIADYIEKHAEYQDLVAE